MIEIEKKASSIADICKILSHKERLTLLCFLIDTKKSVSEITDFLQISQSQTSQFLQKMKIQGIVSTEKIGKQVYYKIADQKVIKLLLSVKEIFCT